MVLVLKSPPLRADTWANRAKRHRKRKKASACGEK
jgi:hypothetical protein